MKSGTTSSPIYQLNICHWTNISGTGTHFIRIWAYLSIAVMSSCVGLIGLASYATRRRTKEIGIRKAHGANVSNIIRLLLAGFLRLIVLANVIAWPVTYYAAKKLAEFSLPYPMEVNIWIFIFVTFFTLLIAATAVIVQTYKAATANPGDSLRYE